MAESFSIQNTREWYTTESGASDPLEVAAAALPQLAVLRHISSPHISIYTPARDINHRWFHFCM